MKSSMDIENLKEYINNLNPEQKKAATLNHGSALILAAAGSGKTSTLICRIAYLIGEKSIEPQQILAVTFTNKAAKEMSTRLWKMGVDTKNLWIGTFHGICNKILRYHTREAGLQKNFYIMDSQEQHSFLKRTIRANGYDPKTVNIDDLQHSINNYKEAGWRSNQLKINSQERKFYEFYEIACKQDNCVDFGELMLGCYELFINYPDIASSYSEKFRHILVDEFQDTNELQYKWLKVLGKSHGQVFAVGDDDQCLVEGTKILTPDGQKNIEDIKVGESILSALDTGLVEKKILHKYQKDFEGALVKITLANGNTAVSTKEHVWFVGDTQNNLEISHNICLCHHSYNEEALHRLEYTILGERHIHTSRDYGRLASLMEKALQMNHSIGHSMNEAVDDIERIKRNADMEIIQVATLLSASLLHIKAQSLTPGMHMLASDGQYHEISAVEEIVLKTVVYDLDIENTHNFFANGIATHNSIYGWRGARPENLNTFLKEFSAQIIKIEKNYRSDANILEAANAVIKNNTNRQGKNLIATRNAQKLINFYSAFNDEQESSFIASEIKKMRRNSISYRDMAILYRTNGQSRSLEKALNAQNIPYIVFGGFRFFDRQEVKHAMAYLRLANNPNDNLAFLRVANIPARAIGDTALQKLDALATQNNCSLFEMAQCADAKTVKKFEPFITVINNLKKSCHHKKLQDMVRLVIVDSGLELMYENDKKDGEERLDNLYELISAAEVFVQENSHPNIEEFLSFSTLESDVQTKKRDENADVVKLMTVHSSKGLEFESVFITGLEENLFPHANSQGEPSLVEEERRLMYVALTRAKTNLYISCSEERLIHGQRNRFIKSRFLKEIPAKLLLRMN